MSKDKKTFEPTDEQKKVLYNTENSLIVSASAGSGKTWILVEYITSLICQKNIPIKRLLVLTFTNAAAGEMKERLLKSILKQQQTPFLIEQLDQLPNADICTIDAFCQKVLKRNLEKTSLDQTFTVLDEVNSTKIKHEAFENAFLSFAEENEQAHQYIYECFKRNKNSIFECLCKIDSFLDSIDDSESLIDKIQNNQNKVFQEACNYIVNYYHDYFEKLLENVKNINIIGINLKYIQVIEKIIKIILNLNFTDLFSLVKSCQDVTLPNMPALRGFDAQPDVASKISDIKEKVKDGIDKLCEYNFDNVKLLKKVKNGQLAKSLIMLYKTFKEEYCRIKAENDYQDFADIEKNCANLLEDKDILHTIQQDYDFVFIDEYQDTNRLQEKLIKKIAKLSNFVAVGDPKQSIYGFRNATMEIMKNDIARAGEDGVVFLRGNFRSDARILNFINEIFKVLMRDDNVGIDYFKTAMLEGKADYEQDDDKAVEVYVVSPQKEEVKENKVYSVKDDILRQKNQENLEIQTIIASIDDLLTKKIYDIKNEMWRSVELSDIVVLMRGRGDLMTNLASELEKQGYSTISDDKFDITQDGEIQVLLNLLKWCISEDEISFTSLLMSKFGNVTPDDMAQFAIEFDKNKQDYDDFIQFIKNSGNKKVNSLLDNIEKFKMESEIFGIARAFELLFDRTNYFAYLDYIGLEKTNIVEKFLSLVANSGFNFSFASLLSYLNSLSSGKVDTSGGDKNAITLMTIHASKGMEFPIVILAGCGKNLNSQNHNPYEIDSELGLATMEYDIDELVKTKTPQLESARLIKKKRELVDELMIFYVALTRAQNKLILTGTYDLKEDYSKLDIFDGKSYFDWLFMTIDKNAVNKLNDKEFLTTDFAEFKKVTAVQSLKQVERENFVVSENKDLTKKIEDYLNFKYPNIKLSKVEFKNSVTGLLKLDLEEEQAKVEIVKPKEYTSGFTPAELGTIYHEILKLVDFDKINCQDDLTKIIEDLILQNYIKKEEVEAVNLNYIYKDIIIIKNILKENNIKKIYKEKAFIMKLPLNEVLDTKFKDPILVQGIIDLFCIGEKNILIDYKYTSINDENILLQKYNKQLDLYNKAIEKAYKIKLNRKYLFSIKNAKLIEYN